ncbi:hypothetical protein Q8F55_008641 [Vanrija albida]|uniref:Uncharacterized protein n=1 Tax=Vanrija albida TaxID=181172 RepID=A0ABR3PSD0_9TREE
MPLQDAALDAPPLSSMLNLVFCILSVLYALSITSMLQPFRQVDVLMKFPKWFFMVVFNMDIYYWDDYSLMVTIYVFNLLGFSLLFGLCHLCVGISRCAFGSPHQTDDAGNADNADKADGADDPGDNPVDPTDVPEPTLPSTETTWPTIDRTNASVHRMSAGGVDVLELGHAEDGFLRSRTRTVTNLWLYSEILRQNQELLCQAVVAYAKVAAAAGVNMTWLAIITWPTWAAAVDWATALSEFKVLELSRHREAGPAKYLGRIKTVGSLRKYNSVMEKNLRVLEKALLDLENRTLLETTFGDSAPATDTPSSSSTGINSPELPGATPTIEPADHRPQPVPGTSVCPVPPLPTPTPSPPPAPLRAAATLSPGDQSFMDMIAFALRQMSLEGRAYLGIRSMLGDGDSAPSEGTTVSSHGSTTLAPAVEISASASLPAAPVTVHVTVQAPGCNHKVDTAPVPEPVVTKAVQVAPVSAAEAPPVPAPVSAAGTEDERPMDADSVAPGCAALLPAPALVPPPTATATVDSVDSGIKFGVATDPIKVIVGMVELLLPPTSDSVRLGIRRRLVRRAPTTGPRKPANQASNKVSPVELPRALLAKTSSPGKVSKPVETRAVQLQAPAIKTPAVQLPAPAAETLPVPLPAPEVEALAMQLQALALETSPGVSLASIEAHVDIPSASCEAPSSPLEQRHAPTSTPVEQLKAPTPAEQRHAPAVEIAPDAPSAAAETGSPQSPPSTKTEPEVRPPVAPLSVQDTPPTPGRTLKDDSPRSPPPAPRESSPPPAPPAPDTEGHGTVVADCDGPGDGSSEPCPAARRRFRGRGGRPKKEDGASPASPAEEVKVPQPAEVSKSLDELVEDSKVPDERVEVGKPVDEPVEVGKPADEPVEDIKVPDQPVEVGKSVDELVEDSTVPDQPVEGNKIPDQPDQPVEDDEAPPHPVEDGKAPDKPDSDSDSDDSEDGPGGDRPRGQRGSGIKRQEAKRAEGRRDASARLSLPSPILPSTQRARSHESRSNEGHRADSRDECRPANGSVPEPPATPSAPKPTVNPAGTAAASSSTATTKPASRIPRLTKGGKNVQRKKEDRARHRTPSKPARGPNTASPRSNRRHANGPTLAEAIAALESGAATQPTIGDAKAESAPTETPELAPSAPVATAPVAIEPVATDPDKARHRTSPVCGRNTASGRSNRHRDNPVTLSKSLASLSSVVTTWPMFGDAQTESAPTKTPESAASEAVAIEPVVIEPAQTEATLAESPPSEPVVTLPMVTDPVVLELPPAEPVTAELPPAEPVAAEEPAPAQAVQVVEPEPQSTDPVPEVVDDEDDVSEADPAAAEARRKEMGKAKASDIPWTPLGDDAASVELHRPLLADIDSRPTEQEWEDAQSVFVQMLGMELEPEVFDAVAYVVRFSDDEASPSATEPGEDELTRARQWCDLQFSDWTAGQITAFAILAAEAAREKLWYPAPAEEHPAGGVPKPAGVTDQHWAEDQFIAEKIHQRMENFEDDLLPMAWILLGEKGYIDECDKYEQTFLSECRPETQHLERAVADAMAKWLHIAPDTLAVLGSLILTYVTATFQINKKVKVKAKQRVQSEPVENLAKVDTTPGSGEEAELVKPAPPIHAPPPAPMLAPPALIITAPSPPATPPPVEFDWEDEDSAAYEAWLYGPQPDFPFDDDEDLDEVDATAGIEQAEVANRAPPTDATLPATGPPLDPAPVDSEPLDPEPVDPEPLDPVPLDPASSPIATPESPSLPPLEEIVRDWAALQLGVTFDDTQVELDLAALQLGPADDDAWLYEPMPEYPGDDAEDVDNVYTTAISEQVEATDLAPPTDVAPSATAPLPPAPSPEPAPSPVATPQPPALDVAQLGFVSFNLSLAAFEEWMYGAQPELPDEVEEVDTVDATASSEQVEVASGAPPTEVPPPAPEALPPAASLELEQPAVVDSQPAVVDAQPVIVDAQPTIVDAQPAVVDAPPAIVDAQPAIVDAEPQPDLDPFDLASLGLDLLPLEGSLEELNHFLAEAQAQPALDPAPEQPASEVDEAQLQHALTELELYYAVQQPQSAPEPQPESPPEPQPQPTPSPTEAIVQSAPDATLFSAPQSAPAPAPTLFGQPQSQSDQAPVPTPVGPPQPQPAEAPAATLFLAPQVQPAPAPAPTATSAPAPAPEPTPAADTSAANQSMSWADYPDDDDAEEFEYPAEWYLPMGGSSNPAPSAPQPDPRADNVPPAPRADDVPPAPRADDAPPAPLFDDAPLERAPCLEDFSMAEQSQELEGDEDDDDEMDQTQDIEVDKVEDGATSAGPSGARPATPPPPPQQTTDYWTPVAGWRQAAPAPEPAPAPPHAPFTTFSAPQPAPQPQFAPQPAPQPGLPQGQFTIMATAPQPAPTNGSTISTWLAAPQPPPTPQSPFDALVEAATAAQPATNGSTISTWLPAPQGPPQPAPPVPQPTNGTTISTWLPPPQQPAPAPQQSPFDALVEAAVAATAAPPNGSPLWLPPGIMPPFIPPGIAPPFVPPPGIMPPFIPPGIAPPFVPQGNAQPFMPLTMGAGGMPPEFVGHIAPPAAEAPRNIVPLRRPVTFSAPTAPGGVSAPAPMPMAAPAPMPVPAPAPAPVPAPMPAPAPAPAPAAASTLTPFSFKPAGPGLSPRTRVVPDRPAPTLDFGFKPAPPAPAPSAAPAPPNLSTLVPFNFQPVPPAPAPPPQPAPLATSASTIGPFNVQPAVPVPAATLPQPTTPAPGLSLPTGPQAPAPAPPPLATSTPAQTAPPAPAPAPAPRAAQPPPSPSRFPELGERSTAAADDDGLSDADAEGEDEVLVFPDPEELVFENDDVRKIYRSTWEEWKKVCAEPTPKEELHAFNEKLPTDMGDLKRDAAALVVDARLELEKAGRTVPTKNTAKQRKLETVDEGDERHERDSLFDDEVNPDVFEPAPSDRPLKTIRKRGLRSVSESEPHIIVIPADAKTADDQIEEAQEELDRYTIAQTMIELKASLADTSPIVDPPKPKATRHLDEFLLEMADVPAPAVRAGQAQSQARASRSAWFDYSSEEEVDYGDGDDDDETEGETEVEVWEEEETAVQWEFGDEGEDGEYPDDY